MLDGWPREPKWPQGTVFWRFFYHLVKTGKPSHQKGADSFTELQKQKIHYRLVRQLEHLGKTVILQPKAETTLVSPLPST